MLRHGRAFLSWWLAELTGLLPDTVRDRFAGPKRHACIVLDGDSLQLADLRGGQSRPLFDLDLAEMSVEEARDALARALRKADLEACPIVLGLPESAILRHREDLPAGTERRLPELLGLKLESTAPLPPGSFYWSYRIIGPAMEGRLAVECVVARKNAVDAPFARLSDLGVQLAGIYPARDLPGEPSLNLLPSHLRNGPDSPWSPLNKALAALAIALAALVLILAFHRQDRQLDALNADLAMLKDRAASVLALRTEALDYAGTLQAVRAAKATAPPLLSVLDELSRLLPDGTWASDLRMQGGEIRLTGQSPSASSLIGLIDKSPLFTNVRFGSPVVRDPRTGTERFNIHFVWAGAEKIAAAPAGPGGAGQ